MVDVWRSVADDSCFLVVGLDSESSRSWNFSGDVDNFAALYDAVDAGYDVAYRYLHGYSAGAHWTYVIGISNSELFSGLGVYAGSLQYAEAYGYWPDAREAPIPVAIAHGTADTTVPYSEAERAYAELAGAGWPVDLYTIDGATHAYDASSEAEAVAFWWAERTP
jgi:predicted esterase